jgi:hypothetical protein
MVAHVPAALRRLVAERAAHRCEYCCFPETLAFHAHEPDHVIPQQHGGSTDEGNLALACFRCNRYKGPNVGSFDPVTVALVPFFNPRSQKWNDHFGWNGAEIVPLTAEGRVTVALLRLNASDRLAEREQLIRCGLLTP